MSTTAISGLKYTKPTSTPVEDFVRLIKKITPITISLEEDEIFTHENIQTFSFAPLEQIRKDLAEEGYSQDEIDREIEALSELPHYAKGNRDKRS